jgi:hypothetical protein
MKNLIIIVGLFLVSTSFAKTKGFEIKLKELSVNGSLDGQPRTLKVEPNKPVVISRSFDSSGVNTVIEMKVTDDDSAIKDGILISLSITEEKDDNKKIIATPKIIVKNGNEAQMTQGKEGETSFIKISLMGTRAQ